MSKPFLHVRADHSVHITGGLVFSTADPVFYFEPHHRRHDIRHSFTGLHIISKLPHWWQLAAWWRILKLLRLHTGGTP